MSVGVLIHAEDPGAANFLAPIPKALETLGIASQVISTGLATELFLSRDIMTNDVSRLSSSTILEKYNPCMLMLGTQENRSSIATDLIQAARQIGIPTACVVDMNANLGERFWSGSQLSRGLLPDWILVTEESARTSLIELGITSDQIVVCGHPHYDYVQERRLTLDNEARVELLKRLLPTSFDPTNPLIVFIAEPHSKIDRALTTASTDDSLIGSGRSTLHSAIVLERIIDTIASRNPKPYLVARLHPKNSLEDFSFLGPDIDYFSQGGDPLELVWCADLVVGIGSSLLMESYLLGKKCLCVMPKRATSHWLSCVRTGKVDCVYTSEDLQDKINELLNASEHQKTISAPLVEPASVVIASFVRQIVETKSFQAPSLL